jgi:pyruvate dehydrogenase E2 component (dihydrolipoamide acetyltransferase)
VATAAGTPTTAGQPAPSEERKVFASPFVRKLARDLDVRLEDVPGSGPQGRVRVADVEAFAQRATAPAPASAPMAEGDQRVPLQGLRKRIAEHMAESVRHAPQVTAIDLFDVTELVRLRAELVPRAKAEGVRLTYLPFVVKAVVEALRAVPYANAVLDEATEEIVLRGAYNIGIATAVAGGLLVPVVKNADRLSLLEVAREIHRLVEAARARRSPLEDLAGGTFTITSYGGLGGGVLYATPILNYPEVAILGIGRIEPQPRVVDGQVVARDCMGVSLTFDHRVLDGEGGAVFLAALRRYLEHPAELLLRLR